MKVYIVNVNNCEAYSDYHEGNRGVYSTYDCKHYDQNDEPSEVYPDSYWCDRLTVYMPPNGFCSFGKRREP